MRLIDADEAIECAVETDESAECRIWETSDVVEFLNDCPTIEAVPVVHGYWVDHYICSNCGKWSTAGLDADVWTSYEPPFCPNCGAKMDKEEN